MIATADIIPIARVSNYLCSDDIENGKLYGAPPDPKLAEAIYTERKSLEWLYDLDPNNITLFGTGQYILALCGKYSISAQVVLNGGSGGSVVTVSGYSRSPYLIPITSANFATATTYNNPLIVGKSLQIFFNDVSRFLGSGEWIATSTGIEILIPGFDATTNSYTLLIYIVN